MQYKDVPIGRMTELNVGAHAIGLLIKISVITGWKIPESKEEKNILYSQFSKKLIEDYYSLNIQEIEYAMRSGCHVVKDWGKNINLSLIDEVLQPYLQQRAQVRKIEEKEIKHKEQEKQEVVLMTDDELIEFHKKLYLKTKSIGLIPFEIYNKLVEKCELDLTKEEKLMVKAQVESRIEAEAIQDGLKSIKELRHEKNHFPDKFKERVKNECYRQSVANYFTKQYEMDKFLNEDK